MKQQGCAIPIVVGIFVTALTTATIRSSTIVSEFLYGLGFEDLIWQKVLAIIIGFASEFSTIFILDKIVKEPKPDNSYSLPVPMNNSKKQNSKSND